MACCRAWSFEQQMEDNWGMMIKKLLPIVQISTRETLAFMMTKDTCSVFCLNLIYIHTLVWRFKASIAFQIVILISNLYFWCSHWDIHSLYILCTRQLRKEFSCAHKAPALIDQINLDYLEYKPWSTFQNFLSLCYFISWQVPKIEWGTVKLSCIAAKMLPTQMPGREAKWTLSIWCSADRAKKPVLHEQRGTSWSAQDICVLGKRLKCFIIKKDKVKYKYCIKL